MPIPPSLPTRTLAAALTLAAGSMSCEQAATSPATTATTSPAGTGADGGATAVAPSGLRVVRMRIGTGEFTLEVADTDAARTRGLMRRDAMPRDAGMIFVFPDEDVRAFWMKDTRIPLDILFLDAAGRVVSIHDMRPYDTRTSTRSAGPAKYAIELNKGAAAETGVKPGDVLEVPPAAREAKE